MEVKCIKIALFFSLFFIFSCTTVNRETQVSISLSPNHQPFLEISNSAVYSTEIIDNDGNLYKSYWQASIISEHRFLDAVSDCDKKFNHWLINGRSSVLSEFERKDISPDNYINYITCITDNGFIMESSKGFLPQGYNIDFSRSHSIRGEFMPVGGTLYIEGKGMSYIEIYDKVVSCEKMYYESKDRQAFEVEFRGIISVNIQPYVENIMSCITDKPYKIKKSKPTKQSGPPE